jgi:hypothetical protein
MFSWSHSQYGHCERANRITLFPCLPILHPIQYTEHYVCMYVQKFGNIRLWKSVYFLQYQKLQRWTRRRYARPCQPHCPSLPCLARQKRTVTYLDNSAVMLMERCVARKEYQDRLQNQYTHVRMFTVKMGSTSRNINMIEQQLPTENESTLHLFLNQKTLMFGFEPVLRAKLTQVHTSRKFSRT